MRCACYARFSSDLQRSTSIEDQIRVCRDYANAQGWTLDDDAIYMDAGVSGASIDGRPGLQALLRDVGHQPLPFDVLLADDSSRVARDLPDAVRVLQRLRFLGVRVIYISQHIDSANEQAETLIAVHGMVDSLYLREATKKIRRGLAGQHSRGFATGGRTFGYRTVAVLDPSGKRDSNGRPATLGCRIEIDAGEAATVRAIFERYADGRGVGAIVASLNREGLKGPRGGRWTENPVRRVLENERYLGRTIWNQSTHERRPGTNRKVCRRVPRDQWCVQDRPELRIVSDDLWQRARARQRLVREAFGLKGGRHLVQGRNAALFSPHLFSGFLRCGICGGAITVVTGGHGSSRYGCPRSWRHGIEACANRLTIRAKVADAALVAGLRDHLLRPETLADVTDALATALNAVLDQRPRLREQADHALIVARRKLQHLVDAVEAGSSAPALLQAITAREAEIARLERERNALDEPLDSKLAVMPGWVRQQLADLAGLLASTPERTKGAFRDLGIGFTLVPVTDAGRPFLRAESDTDVSRLISGQFPVSTTDRSDPRRAR